MSTHKVTKQADNGQKLLLEVTVGQLKTIRSDAVVRQERMKMLARSESDAQNWEIYDAAVTEAEKSYGIGVWADKLLSSLSPERVDDEWFAWGERSARFRDFEDAPSPEEIFEGIRAARSFGS